MNCFKRSHDLVKFMLLILAFVVVSQAVYADTTLDVTTTNMGDTLYFTYTFNFSTSSPSSIIAIEKPEDSVFINAYDNFDMEYDPLVIGDFYRFELDNRDINSYTIRFTSSQILRDIYEKDEQVFYVNSNIDIDEIRVTFDLVRPYSEVLNVYPRNFELKEEESRITTTQEGSLNDNLFRISYEPSDSMSVWIFVLLSIPILFFVLLYISLKTKPNSKDKNLGEYIKKVPEKKNEDASRSHREGNKTLITPPQEMENEIVYTFEEKSASNTDQDLVNSAIEKKDNSTVKSKTTESNRGNSYQNLKKSKLNDLTTDSNETDKQVSSINKSNIGTNELEEYIQKYFTDNEQDVIRIISQNEGLMQQEILDSLSIFTKSTLSKILSKLENKKMIERVRVGKVNKLFIGEELKKLIKNEKEETGDNDEKKK